MAREGITDLYDGVEAYYRGLYHHINNRAMNIGISYDQFIEERIAIKAKRFNSILNRAADNDDQYSSDDYRKESDGE